jgi:hypothetical protein
LKSVGVEDWAVPGGVRFGHRYPVFAHARGELDESLSIARVVEAAKAAAKDAPALL